VFGFLIVYYYIKLFNGLNFIHEGLIKLSKLINRLTKKDRIKKYFDFIMNILPEISDYPESSTAKNAKSTKETFIIFFIEIGLFIQNK